MTKADAPTAAGPQATPASAPKRRTRGPNKPKPASLLEVRVDATMSQSAIAKVLADYVAQEQDGDTAAEMELQISNISTGVEEKPWRPMTGPDAGTAIIRFATKGSR